jgi:colanic acid/amylovoran biosynthesis glycosyltransferase
MEDRTSTVTDAREIGDHIIGLPCGLSYTGGSLPNSSPIQLPPFGEQRPRVGYLLSRYPAISHTFFLKEVLGMRERGLQVEVASINPPDRPRKDLPPVETAEADQTYYVKSTGFAAIAFRVLAIAVSHPAVTLRGLRAVLRLGEWDLKSRAFGIFYLAEALLVGRWMRSRSLSHLHVHFGGPVATVGMLTAKAWRMPWSLTLHGPDEFFDQEAFYLRQKIESASFVVCISDFCRSQVLRIAPGLEESRLEVVRLGVDCDALHPLESDLALRSISNQSNPLKFVCTGRMVAAKGHRILLEALAPLASEDIDFSCSLIGDGPERGALETLCAQLGLADRTRFLGAMAHQPTLFEVARADVFVLASFAEGLPVALMEAMALGVPCVSTTIAAIPELIDDQVNGLLVPPANPAALHMALKRLAEDSELRRRLAQKARSTVESSYNLPSNLNLLAEIWRRRLGELR